MKRIWLILTAFIVIAMLGLVTITWKTGGFTTLFLKSCSSNTVFSVSPISPDQFVSITPLGNLNPPDHTIPTDHMYINVKATNSINPSLSRQVVSPGDVTVTRIQFSRQILNGQERTADYAIDFQPCKQISMNFGHLTQLSPQLQAAYDKHKGKCATHYSGSAESETYCNAELSLKITAGSLVGQAGGGLPTGLDIQAINRREQPLNYANNTRYSSETRHIACPLDLFAEPVKSQLLAKVGTMTQTGFKARTIEPLCGTVDQDKIGSLQGNWITGGGQMDSPETWSKTLALVHDNNDPTIGAGSIGGVIGSPQKIPFRQTHSGTINREWSEVTPGATIYCYYNDQLPSPDQATSNRLLIRLVSDQQLQAEIQPGLCAGNVSFNQPTIYLR